MNNDFLNTHGSLLRFCSDSAAAFATLTNAPFAPINLDAVASEVDLPNSNLVGLQEFSIRSESDDDPVSIVTCAIVVSTQEDVNNTRLTKALNELYNQLQPSSAIPLFDLTETSEVVLGNMVIVGRSHIAPVERGESSRAFQSLYFNAGVIYDDA